ncbi:hypothetical protein EMPG_14528 [Blastomyces silverae]|uniref:Uncharacterized protein n=1 Tax=Blastomyces silverae TaxID=2060906 RepID=A0A0H1BLL2_9EURO|nr:hypothetical protein EMPG_14528 [Blastomyces silverae]
MGKRIRTRTTTMKMVTITTTSNMIAGFPMNLARTDCELREPPRRALPPDPSSWASQLAHSSLSPTRTSGFRLAGSVRWPCPRH